MRLQQIIHIIQENLLLGIIGVIALGIFLWIGYFVIYKKILKGKRNFSRKKLIMGGLFTCYIIMVLGVTFLNRSSFFERSFNIHFLSSYIEAWNNFSIWHWQFIIFNILMFVPLGILLPLMHKRFHQLKWTIAAGLLFTLLIEGVQYATGFGIFDLDDVFNNLLGTWVGFGIVKAIMSLRQGQEKRFRKALGNLSPLFIVIALFSGIFALYHLQEFGNLSTAPVYRVNMNDVKTTLHVELSKERKMVPIYQAPTLTKDSAKEFAREFFNKMEADWSDVKITDLDNEVIYEIGKYHLWVKCLDGSYDFNNFSIDYESVQGINVAESQVLNGLKKFGISIPEGATVNKREDGGFGWIVDKKIVGDRLTDGELYCTVDKDSTIRYINNQLVVSKKVRNVPIKSEMDAYQELLEGKFFTYLKDLIEKIEILQVELEYQLDSKGFNQPIYVFDCNINGEEYPIFISAM